MSLLSCLNQKKSSTSNKGTTQTTTSSNNAQVSASENKKIDNKQDKYITSLEALQNNLKLSDKDKIMQILQNLFTAKAEDYVNNLSFDFSIYMDKSNGLSKTQKFFIDNIILQKKLLKRSGAIIDTYTINTKINNISENKDEAVVKLAVDFDFHYKDCGGPSSTGLLYTIKLKKNGNKWLITDIQSDDSFEKAALTGNIDMDKYIKDADQPASDPNIKDK